MTSNDSGTNRGSREQEYLALLRLRRLHADLAKAKSVARAQSGKWGRPVLRGCLLGMGVLVIGLAVSLSIPINSPSSSMLHNLNNLAMLILIAAGFYLVFHIERRATNEPIVNMKAALQSAVREISQEFPAMTQRLGGDEALFDQGRVDDAFGLLDTQLKREMDQKTASRPAAEAPAKIAPVEAVLSKATPQQLEVIVRRLLREDDPSDVDELWHTTPTLARASSLALRDGTRDEGIAQLITLANKLPKYKTLCGLAAQALEENQQYEQAVSLIDAKFPAYLPGSQLGWEVVTARPQKTVLNVSCDHCSGHIEHSDDVFLLVNWIKDRYIPSSLYCRRCYTEYYQNQAWTYYEVLEPSRANELAIRHLEETRRLTA